MKALFGKIILVLVGVAATALAGPRLTSAQTPDGPQTGSQPTQGTTPPPPAAPQKKPEQSGATISVDVPVVTLEVIATTKNGDILTGLKKENFRITDNGVPQAVTNFGPVESPITMVMLLEFGGRGYGFFSAYARYWADGLFPYLQQKDWIALETFDMKTRLEVDFTQNKEEVRSAINHLYFPGFNESNVFDAILETNERLKDVKGKKSILLLASGRDTFSKNTLDQTMKKLRQSDVTIFAVGLGKVFTNALESRGSLGSNIDYIQAENQLKTFAQQTGGYAWFPQFTGEIPGIMQSVAGFLRHQYSLSYSPTAGARDGKFHKVKVELVAPDGGPLTVVDQKGKKQKYVVYAREGYEAPKEGIGN
jgi:VWFA-related protein